MAQFKTAKIGLYQNKDRALQKRMSYEHVSLSWKSANVYRYLGDYTKGAGSSITDIQDNLFLENTDRRYDSNPVEINIHMDEMNESGFDLSKFGIIPILGDTQLFRIHVNSFDDIGMGRYVMVGDVFEIPFLQENGNAGNKTFFEVTDVDRKMEFEKFYVVVTTVPIKDSQEFKDIDGIPSNSDALDGIQSMLDDAYDATFIKEGLSPEPSLFCERGFVEDGFWNVIDTFSFSDESNTRKEYISQPNDDWLTGDTF